MKSAHSTFVCFAAINLLWAIFTSANAQSKAETYGYIHDTILNFGGYKSDIIEERYTNLFLNKGDEFHVSFIIATKQGEIKTYGQGCDLSKAYRITTINSENFSSLLITGQDCKFGIKFPRDSVFPHKVKDAFIHYSKLSGYNLKEIPYDPDLF